MLTTKQIGRNNLRLNALLPEVRERVTDLLTELAAIGLYFVVCNPVVRTVEEQDALYAQGRTAPGPKVTNARGGYSWHNFARAVDLALVRNGGEIEWRDLDLNSDGISDYTQMGQVAKNHGFVWGGDFKRVRDLGHIEYHPGLTLKEARRKEGIEDSE